MTARAAVDIGGTFTDLVTLDEESGAIGIAKASTTPGRFEDGVMDAIEQADLDGVSVTVPAETAQRLRRRERSATTGI